MIIVTIIIITIITMIISVTFLAGRPGMTEGSHPWPGGQAILSEADQQPELHVMSGSFKALAISPLGIIFDLCLYKTQEDIKDIVFIQVLRGVSLLMAFAVFRS